jgi:hypothetical protein
MGTISQRITIEGGDDVKKQLEDIGKAGEKSVKQIQDAAQGGGDGFTKVAEAASKAADAFAGIGAAAEQIGARLSELTGSFAGLSAAVSALAETAQASFAGAADATDKFGTAVGQVADKLTQIEAEGGKAAEAIQTVSVASQQATANLQQSTQAADNSSKSYAGLGLAAVRTGASVVSAGASVAGAATGVATLGVSAIGAAAQVGTFALVLGRVLLGAVGAAVVGIEALSSAAQGFANKYQVLNQQLQALAQTSGTSFESLQKGSQALEAMGIKAETARSAVLKLDEQLKGFDVGAKLKESADKLLETEKALLEAQLAVDAAGGKRAPYDAAARLVDINRQLEAATSERAKAEEAASKASEARAAALANDLARIIPLIKAIEEGQQGITFDEATTAATKIDALNARLKQIKDTTGDARQAFVSIIANAASLKDALAFGKLAGFSDADVDRIRRFGGEAGKIPDLFKRMEQSGALIGPRASASFDRMRTSIEDVENAWTRLQQAWQSTIFAEAAARIGSLLNDIEAGFINFVAQGLEAFNRLVNGIVDYFARVPAAVDASIAQVKSAIETWVTTPVSNAWQWIVDTFNSTVSSLGAAIDQATALITTWVTKPVANAWQWIKDAFNSVVSSLFGGGGGGKLAADAGLGDIGSHAGGGLLGGRGSGTSDSNLIWASRGEHIMPARAVAQPGVLAFLETLRRSGGNLRDVLDGMGRFALGGPIGISGLAAGGMGSRNLGTLTLGLPGGSSVQVMATFDVVDQLRKAAALGQVRSGGRKPSRFS